MATKAIPVAYAVPSSQSNFPVLIQPSLMTGWGSLTTAEANSIRFYSDSGLTTELAREVVSADEIWVKVGTLTSSTVIYADYDGVRSDYSVGDTYGRNAVWTGYLAVYHLQSLTVDSTGNSRTLTNFNSVQSASAKINDGADGTTSNTNRKLGIANDLGVTGSAVSISTWFRAHSLPASGVRRAVAWQSDNGTIVSQFIAILNIGGTTTVRYARDRHCVGEVVVGSGAISANTWYHAVYTYDATNIRGYLDGSSVGTSGTATGNGTCAGFYPDGYNLLGNTRNQEYMSGLVDEARITQTVLSADWIATEYNNQNNVATFWGTVTDAGGGANPTGFFAFF
jgi:hypothetical protein